jgi:hypothetical protein
MSYLRYLCLFAYSDFPTHIALWFFFFVLSMLPVSLDYPPFLIAPSIFSNVYCISNPCGRQKVYHCLHMPCVYFIYIYA